MTIDLDRLREIATHAVTRREKEKLTEHDRRKKIQQYQSDMLFRAAQHNIPRILEVNAEAGKRENIQVYSERKYGYPTYEPTASDRIKAWLESEGCNVYLKSLPVEGESYYIIVLYVTL